MVEHSALTAEPPPGDAEVGGGGQMKLTAVWIPNVLADMARHTEKQKLWAQTAACGASLCAHRRSRAILRNTHPAGGLGAVSRNSAGNLESGICVTRPRHQQS